MATSENIHLGPILYCELSTKLLFPGVHGTRHRISRPSWCQALPLWPTWLQLPPSQDAIVWKIYQPPGFKQARCQTTHTGALRDLFSFQIPNPAYPTPNKLCVHFLWKTLVCALVVPWKDNTRCLLGNEHKTGGPSISGSVLWVPFYVPCFKGPFTVWRHPSLGI